ncbi:hypothetical protein PV762_11655 [Mitsuaria sp. CC2]|uniref:hypothetical protein n=1 Tax=Mitsuaria sp. CC2 TaxID=3029186 RepID=UPI003B8E9D38
MQDVAMAGRFGAHYLTTSSFATAVLDPEPWPPDIKSATASGLLQMSLPFFEQVPLPLLMAARTDEEAFHRFRLQLEKHFRELRLEADPIKRKARAENAMHELLEVQLTEIDSAVKRLRRKTVWNAAAAVASLVAAIPTGGQVFSPAPTPPTRESRRSRSTEFLRGITPPIFSGRQTARDAPLSATSAVNSGNL